MKNQLIIGIICFFSVVLFVQYANAQVKFDAGGQVKGTGFCINESCISSWTQGLWVESGGNIYRESGNVGIGTATPTEKLDVAGSIQTDYFIINPQDGVNEGGELRLEGTGGYSDVQIDNYQGNVRIHTLSSGNNFQVLGGGAFFDGNVGIGISSPTGKLNIHDSADWATIILSTDADPGNEWMMGYKSDWDGSADNSFSIARNQGGWIDHFVIQPGGNVGIGTTSPTAKLDVAGDINMDASRTIYSRGRMHIHGEEDLYILNMGATRISNHWGGTGDLHIDGQLCVKGGCSTIVNCGPPRYEESNCRNYATYFSACDWRLCNNCGCTALNPSGRQMILHWPGY